MADRQASQRALVTGASSGIGRATALALADSGADVALTARRADRLRTLKREIESEHGVRAVVIPADMTDERAVEGMVETAAEAFDGLDVVVNNAGIDAGKPVEETTTEEFRRTMAVNVEGTFVATRTAIPHVRASNGHLIFVGSITARYPHAYPVYAASKWWVRGFALSLGASLGADGIAVTVVHPSGVRSEFGEDTPSKERFSEDEAIEPEDVADTIVFAAGRENATVSELDVFARDRIGDL